MEWRMTLLFRPAGPARYIPRRRLSWTVSKAQTDFTVFAHITSQVRHTAAVLSEKGA